jgi:hypothetical protein
LSWPELTGSPRNLDEFVSSCRKEFPDLKDWHDVPADWFDPTQGGHYTNELANDTGMFRDQYIYKLLLQHVRQGERVFAVIGASHVVVQEPAWRETFGTPILYMNGPSK